MEFIFKFIFMVVITMGPIFCYLHMMIIGRAEELNKPVDNKTLMYAFGLLLQMITSGTLFLMFLDSNRYHF